MGVYGLADLVFFIVKSESKRSPGTDFAAEDMKETIRAIFVSETIRANFLISNRIARKRSNIRNSEYESNIRPILSVQDQFCVHNYLLYTCVSMVCLFHTNWQ